MCNLNKYTCKQTIQNVALITPVLAHILVMYIDNKIIVILYSFLCSFIIMTVLQAYNIISYCKCQTNCMKIGACIEGPVS